MVKEELKPQSQLLPCRAVPKGHGLLCSGETGAPNQQALIKALHGAWPGQKEEIRLRFGPIGRNEGAEIRK